MSRACGSCDQSGTDGWERGDRWDWSDSTHTRLRPGPVPADPGPGCVLVMDDGSAFALHRPLVLGRDPQPEQGSDVAVIRDSGLTISKTHIRVAASDTGVAVTDLQSTNGVLVTPLLGDDYWLEPGRPAILMVGACVHLGERSFRIESAAQPVMGMAAPRVHRPAAPAGAPPAVPDWDLPATHAASLAGPRSDRVISRIPLAFDGEEFGGPDPWEAECALDDGREETRTHPRWWSAIILLLLGLLAIITRELVLVAVGALLVLAASYVAIGNSVGDSGPTSRLATRLKKPA